MTGRASVWVNPSPGRSRKWQPGALKTWTEGLILPMTKTKTTYCKLHYLENPCPVCSRCDHWRWANAPGLGPICQDCGLEIDPPEGVRPMTSQECAQHNKRFDAVWRAARRALR